MSNANAFGTGFLQGIGAINSIYDRKLRQQEYADNKAFQQKKYADSRADRAQDADYRNKVFGLHQQTVRPQNHQCPEALPAKTAPSAEHPIIWGTFGERIWGTPKPSSKSGAFGETFGEMGNLRHKKTQSIQRQASF